MDRRNFSPVLLILAIIILLVLAVLAVSFWSSVQSSPASQFSLARYRWEINSISHYRMEAGYYGNRSQCYYDVEVRQERIARVFAVSCLSSAEPKILTIGGIFETFERYATQKVCSPHGCYCEGNYVVRATYDPTLGYPQNITTSFRRYWLDDLLHGKIGVQQCLLRTNLEVDSFERIKVTILP